MFLSFRYRHFWEENLKPILLSEYFRTKTNILNMKDKKNYFVLANLERSVDVWMNSLLNICSLVKRKQSDCSQTWDSI